MVWAKTTHLASKVLSVRIQENSTFCPRQMPKRITYELEVWCILGEVGERRRINLTRRTEET